MGIGDRHTRRGRLTASALALTASVLGLAKAAAAQNCVPDRADLRGDWGTARFSIELADEPREQRRGLMFRESLATTNGMLFTYPSPGAPAFWMKNTVIALDMLFISPEGVVRHVHENATPGDLTPISGGDGILAVLEIKGGTAALMGITIGSEIRHPAFDPAIAAWACTDEN